MAEFRKQGGFGGKRGGGGFRGGGGGRPQYPNPTNRDREMFSAVCANCGKNCQVPFRPSGDRPVLCKECFSENKPEESRGEYPRRDAQRSFDRRPSPSFSAPARPAPQTEDKRIDELNIQVSALHKKLDKVTELLKEMVMAKGDEIQQVELAKAVKIVTKKKPAKK